ncbi:hypothetical protein MBLNU459_g4857t1 [Dothideomycetes sp. NU459]
MPVLTLHLIQLVGDGGVSSFIAQLKEADPSAEIVVASQPRYLVVRPEKQDVNALSGSSWDVMLLIRTAKGALHEALRPRIAQEYKMFVGIPSKLLAAYPKKNRQLLEEAPSAGLTGSLDNPIVPDSSQNLELSPDLLRFMDELMKQHNGPVTMLNLLKFKEGGKSSYYEYGQRFIEVARKRGGDAKIVGNVIPPPTGHSNVGAQTAGADEWQEIAIVHYASIKHFCDMLAGADYQAINDKYRLPALEDTLLMCTTEIDLAASQKSKL